MHIKLTAILDKIKKYFLLINRSRSNSYLTRLSFVLGIFLFIPFSIIVSIYAISMSNSVKNNFRSGYEAKLAATGDEYSSFMLGISNKLDFLQNYSQIYKLLSVNEKQSTLINIEETRQLANVVSALFEANYKINLQIYTDNPGIYIPQYFTDIKKAESLSYFNDILSLESNKTYYTLKKDETGKYFCAYRKCKNLNKTTGIIEISIPYDDFRKLFKVELPNNSLSYALNSNGSIFVLGDIPDDELYRICTNGSEPKNYLKLVKHIQISDIMLYFFIPKKIYIGQINTIMLLWLLSVLIVAFLIFLVAKITAKSMTKRLTEITDMILEGGGGLNGQKYYDEFDIIANKLIEYSNYIKEKNESEVLEKKRLLGLELMLLQERISPHFLYNTLASIKWVYKDKKLGKIIDSMVKYYRIALNTGSNLIKTRDELSGINEYLKLQMFAYGKSFRYDIIFDEQLGDLKILKNLIQPIVENAFLHGVNLISDDSGFIKIEVRQDNENVIFTIENNGPSITEEALSKIAALSENGFENGGGYALVNVIKRIRLHYGAQYGLKAYADNGTKIEIIIPAENTASNSLQKNKKEYSAGEGDNKDE